MSNEKKKKLHLLTMCFIVMDWAVRGIYKALKAYLPFTMCNNNASDPTYRISIVFNNETFN